MEMPNPSPLSSNCDVVRIWNGSGNGAPAPQPAPVVDTTPSPAAIPNFSAPAPAPVAPAVPAAALPDDSVQSLMTTMQQKPNLIDIVENVEAAADPVVAQPVTPVEVIQQPVAVQSTPVTVPGDDNSTIVPQAAVVDENANFSGIPEMGGFDTNGMATTNFGMTTTPNLNAPSNGLIKLTSEVVQ